MLLLKSIRGSNTSFHNEFLCRLQGTSWLPQAFPARMEPAGAVLSCEPPLCPQTPESRASLSWRMQNQRDQGPPLFFLT